MCLLKRLSGKAVRQPMHTLVRFDFMDFLYSYNDFLNEISNDQNLKSIINKKNLKIVKPWLIKVDAYFKDLKLGTLINTKPLLSENEKVFGILNISITKLFIKSKK